MSQIEDTVGLLVARAMKNFEKRLAALEGEIQSLKSRGILIRIKDFITWAGRIFQ